MITAAIFIISTPLPTHSGTYGWNHNSPLSPLTYDRPYTFFLDNGYVRYNPDDNFYHPDTLSSRSDYYYDYDDTVSRVGDTALGFLDDTLQASQKAVTYAVDSIGWKWIPFMILALSLVPEYHHIVKRDLNPGNVVTKFSITI